MRRQITVWFILGVLVIIAVYDGWASYKGYDYTITCAVRTISKHNPIISGMAFLAVGYWLGRARRNTINKSGGGGHAS